MANIPKQREIIHEQGLEITPGDDWVVFSKEVLGVTRGQERHVGLGVVTGQLIVDKLGNTEPRIINVISDRFAAATEPPLDFEVKRAFDEGIYIARVAHRALQEGVTV